MTPLDITVSIHQKHRDKTTRYRCMYGISFSDQPLLLALPGSASAFQLTSITLLSFPSASFLSSFSSPFLPLPLTKDPFPNVHVQTPEPFSVGRTNGIGISNSGLYQCIDNVLFDYGTSLNPTGRLGRLYHKIHFLIR